MDKIKIIKAVVGFTASFGTTNVVYGIVAQNATQETNLQKATVFVSKVIVAAMINETIRGYTDSKVDLIAAALSKTATS